MDDTIYKMTQFYGWQQIKDDIIYQLTTDNGWHNILVDNRLWMT